MSKRIVRIWSVGLTVMLLASLLLMATPVSAALGNQQFVNQPLPDNTGFVLQNGSDVTDIAVARAGNTIYVVDSALPFTVNTTAPGAVYKSTDGGQSFIQLTAYNAILPVPLAPIAIDVAPDNAEAIAVTDGVRVFTSNNGGTTWSAMPAFVPAGSARDVAVGPARSGTLLGREYAIAVADPTTATTALGDVLIIGSTAAWQSAGQINGPGETEAPITGDRDYMAVAFTPNFVGDRTLVAVGFAAASNIRFQYFNTSTFSLFRSSPISFSPATTTIDFATVGALTNVVKADIALPLDYDSTTSSGRVGYVSFAAAATFTDNDVYRIDDNTSRALGSPGGAPVWSISFAGTISGGTLVMGRSDLAETRVTTNPTTSSPTWTASRKLVPGNTTATVVRMAPDFASSNKVYLGSTGAESALQVSMDGGFAYNGEALIDNVVGNNVGVVQSLEMSPDGKWLFMATSDTAVGTAGDLSLWKSASPPVTGATWSRVYVVAKAVALTSTALARVSPEWATTPAVFFLDTAVTGTLFRSTNGGDTFASRFIPTGLAAAPADLAVQTADVIYLASGVNVFKSTIGGFTWTDPVDAKAGVIVDLVVAKADHLIVGGTTIFSYSTDGAATFTKVEGNAGETYRVAADDAYATNNIIYLANAAGVGNYYRFQIGTDATLVNIVHTGDLPAANPPSPAIGLVVKNKALYAAVNTAAPVAKIDRTLGPTSTPGNVRWTSMNVGVPAFAAPGATAFALAADKSNTAYLAGVVAGVPTLAGYEDFLATAKPVISSPADKFNVPIDPVTGRAEVFTFVFNSIGSGTGLVNAFNVQLWEKTAGVAAAGITGDVTVSNPTSPEFNTNALAGGTIANVLPLRANTVYQWRIRAGNQVSGDDIVSGFSDTREFTVQSGGVVIQTQSGPVLLGPQAGGMNVPTSTGFSWAPIAGATKYEVILATDSGLTQRVAGTPVQVTSPGWKPAQPLAANTSYVWSVRAIEPTASPVAIGTFNTAAPPAAPPPPPAPPATVTVTPAPVIIPQTLGPGYIWAIIGIGAVLVIAVIVLIVRTRRVA